MPLFGSARDASFLRYISKEIINKIISVEVEIYKLSIDDSEINIYGEGRSKVYFHPLRINALVRSDPRSAIGDDNGIDFQKTISFAFLRDSLVDVNLVIEVGDIVKWDVGYYQVDNIIADSQFWMGRNPATHIPRVQNEIPEFGYNVSVVAETHLTKESALDLIDGRSGITRNNNLPRDL